jgi:diguanylate cyclase (GGDEF)-like protein/PAS domain S-box-containing protein
MNPHMEYNILLVEDDPGHAEIITRAFETEPQCLLTTTESLDQANVLINSSHLDLIITDVRLPDGEGTDLLKESRSCPTIVMTSYSDEKAAVDAIKSGAADYIVKTRETMAALPRIANRVMHEWRLLIDQKLAQERQQRFTAILEATPDLVCIANLDGFLTYINQSGRRLLGISDSEQVNRIRLADFHSEEEGEKILSKGIPSAIYDGLWTTETNFLSRSGDKILSSLVLISHRNDRGEMEFFSIIARDIRGIRAAEEKVEYLAYYDTLTGLPNRNELLKRLAMEVARVNRNHTHGALLFIDLDNFKYINDSLGHPVGDLVLQEMAQRLKSHLRGGDTVARLGGDEFVVILSELSSDSLSAVNQARKISNNICSTISLEFINGGIDLHVTASIGITMISEGDSSGHDLLRYADTAMYQAKRGGRNRLEFFSEHMSDDVSRQLDLEIQLRRALRKGEFRLFYQPLVNQSMATIGAEVLIRWEHPERGLLAPIEFLDVLESSGQIIEVGSWVINTALKQLSVWIGAGIWHSDMKLCINTSPRQFTDSRFANTIHSQLDGVNVPTECIVLEVTEHNIIHNVGEATEKMKDLIKRGVSFSLDDFGTGYSSLSHLRNLPVRHIKIDRSFVSDICENADDEAMVASILALSKHLRLQVVAEGVENSEQFHMLKKYNCQYFQGYFFSKPLSTRQMTARLEKDSLRVPTPV